MEIGNSVCGSRDKRSFGATTPADRQCVSDCGAQGTWCHKTPSQRCTLPQNALADPENKPSGPFYSSNGYVQSAVKLYKINSLEYQSEI